MACLKTYIEENNNNYFKIEKNKKFWRLTD